MAGNLRAHALPSSCTSPTPVGTPRLAPRLAKPPIVCLAKPDVSSLVKSDAQRPRVVGLHLPSSSTRDVVPCKASSSSSAGAMCEGDFEEQITMI